jgi:hypothetical protein
MNYTGPHPLNLIGKGMNTTHSPPSLTLFPLTKQTVAIITSASSLGASVCRALLNSNTLVLSLDTVPAHKTTNASGESHFQFLQYDEGDGSEVLEKLRCVFLKDEVDFWTDVVGELRIGALKEVVDGMSEKGRGWF